MTLAVAFADAVRIPRGPLSFFLVLDAPVLEPNLHLLLRQVQVGCDFNPAKPRQVHVRGELPLELQELGTCEGCSHPLAVL